MRETTRELVLRSLPRRPSATRAPSVRSICAQKAITTDSQTRRSWTLDGA